MSDLHPTITDKDREVGMNENGEWNVWQVKGFDGLIEPDFLPPLLPGDETLPFRTFYVDVNVGGVILAMPARKAIGVRFDRYPFDPADNGTGWDTIDLRPFDEGDRWYGSWSGKVEIYLDGSYSTSVGLGYRVIGGGGALKIDDRVVKFLRQIDARVV